MRTRRAYLDKGRHIQSLLMEMPLDQSLDPKERLRQLLIDQLGIKYLMLIQDGLQPVKAAEYCGVTSDCHAHWMKQGKRDAVAVEMDGGIYSHEARYYLQTKAVVASRQAEDIAWFRQLAQEETSLWGAYLAVQERLNPEEYGKKSAISLDTNNKVEITFKSASSKEWLNGKSGGEVLANADAIETVLIKEAVKEEILDGD